MRGYPFFIALVLLGILGETATRTPPARSTLPGPLPTLTSFNSYPHWSPDGSQIVFSSDRQGNSDLYVIETSGHHLTRLTWHDSVDSHPAWMVRASYSYRGGSVALYTMQANGDQVEKVEANR